MPKKHIKVINKDGIGKLKAIEYGFATILKKANSANFENKTPTPRPNKMLIISTYKLSRNTILQISFLANPKTLYKPNSFFLLLNKKEWVQKINNKENSAIIIKPNDINDEITQPPKESITVLEQHIYETI